MNYDAELVRYASVLRGAWALRPGDRVLDIGCGAGETTRAAALVTGSALGIDLSVTEAPGPPGVRFARGDAQVFPFEPGSFDVAISRFGTMFFDDLDIGLTDVQVPVCYGPDADAALGWVRGFTCTNCLLQRLDTAAEARALSRLRATLASHTTTDGVWFASRAWLVTARSSASRS
jgi:SAM-dependent methyltransferase